MFFFQPVERRTYTLQHAYLMARRRHQFVALHVTKFTFLELKPAAI